MKEEAMKSDVSLRSCSTRKRKKIECEDEKRKRKKKKSIMVQTLEEGDEGVKKSDMTLKSCSSRKRKKIQSGGDEKGKNKKKIKISGEKGKKRKHHTLNRKEDMVNLRLGRFLSRKRIKNKARSYWSYFSDPGPLQQGKINEGDTVDISELLFTQDRDFLITYNDRDRPVQAQHLKGKVIVLHFVPLGPWSESYMTFDTTILLDIYRELQPKGGFEVVFVGVEVDYFPSPDLDCIGENFSTLEDCFEYKFSSMPWTAIPFSDFKSRKLLETRFPLSGFLSFDTSTSVVIDPTGKVLRSHANNVFESYGARAYPFTDERMKCILSENDEARKHPSITKLLASLERNFLINKNNQAVPLCDLEDKVVGLYFCKGDDHYLAEKILEAYKQLAKVKNFEIVLVYIHDGFLEFKHTSEKSYWQCFREMPWLALPYKDPVCKTLQQVFNHSKDADTDGGEPNPNLVIIGPQGKFVERFGADIIMKYGISAYPFTRKKVAKLEAKKMREWNLFNGGHENIPLVRKDGSIVKLSQLMGKRIILIAEIGIIGFNNPDAKFWRMLRARYLQMKGTNDEFEVIHICTKEGYSYGKNIATTSWLTLPANCEGSSGSRPLGYYIFVGGLFAFDRDGSLVRRTRYPSIERENMDFPFYSGGLKEVLRDVIGRHQWNF